MNDHIVFVTQEFEPVIPGGAATVIAGLRDHLAADHRVGVLLAATESPPLADPDVEIVDVPASDGTAASWDRRVEPVLARVDGEGLRRVPG